MATNISYGFNTPKNNWMVTLKRSFTLGRCSKNTFTPNPENHALTGKVEFLYRTATLSDFKKNTPKESAFHLRNRAKTLGGIRKEGVKVTLGPLTALEQAKQLFASPEHEDFNAERDSLLQVLFSKVPHEINRKLQRAKNSFQNESYKDAKKKFKKILQSKSLEQEKTTIELYLATIYLLQGKVYKAKKYLEGKPTHFIKGDTISLAQAMYSHVSYLIKKKEAPEKIRGPCLISQCYEKTEGFSEEEKVMAKKLCKKF